MTDTTTASSAADYIAGEHDIAGNRAYCAFDSTFSAALSFTITVLLPTAFWFGVLMLIDTALAWDFSAAFQIGVVAVLTGLLSVVWFFIVVVPRTSPHHEELYFVDIRPPETTLH